MESNLINIKLIKTPRNPKEKYLFPSYKLSITNLDNFLTEKIISKNLESGLFTPISSDIKKSEKYLDKFALSSLGFCSEQGPLLAIINS